MVKMKAVLFRRILVTALFHEVQKMDLQERCENEYFIIALSHFFQLNIRLKGIALTMT